MNFLHKDRLMKARFQEPCSFETVDDPLPARLRLRHRLSPISPTKKRRSLSESRTRPISAGPRIQPPMRRAVFAYLGGSSRVVIGPATGTIYRFKAPGARVRIDPRDAAALQKLAALSAIN